MINKSSILYIKNISNHGQPKNNNQIITQIQIQIAISISI
jgi:hypothetical protein